MTKQKPVCSSCGSEEVLADAYTSWNLETNQWELSATFDKGSYCEAHDGECRIEWVDVVEPGEA